MVICWLFPPEILQKISGLLMLIQRNGFISSGEQSNLVDLDVILVDSCLLCVDLRITHCPVKLETETPFCLTSYIEILQVDACMNVWRTDCIWLFAYMFFFSFR